MNVGVAYSPVYIRYIHTSQEVNIINVGAC